MGLQGWERSLTISSAIWIQEPYINNVTDGQTTDTRRQQRPSCGKNWKMSCIRIWKPIGPKSYLIFDIWPTVSQNFIEIHWEVLHIKYAQQTYRQTIITAIPADRSQQAQHSCQWLASAWAPSQINYISTAQCNTAAKVQTHVVYTM